MTPTAFVLMPFASEFDDIYENVIRTTLLAEGFFVTRADESQNSRSIMHDVIHGILRSDLIIADLTGSNPNVYYEVGLAHAFGKKVILLAQDINEVPFDLRAYRVITYSTHFARVAEARKQLQQFAKGAKEGITQFGSPVSDLGICTLGAENLANAIIRSTVVTATIEPSPLDVAADFEEGMSDLSSITTEIGQRLILLNPIVRETNEKLRAARYDVRTRRAFVRTLAQQMNDFAAWLKIANGRYRSSLQTITQALDAIFALNNGSAFSSRERSLAFVDTVLDVETSAANAREHMSLLTDTLDGIPKLEQSFDRARPQLSEEIRALVSSIDQTEAVMSRTRTAGQTLLGDNSD